MTVERIHAGRQARYTLRDERGLSCVLTCTAELDELATWKILLPGVGGARDLYSTRRFPDLAGAGLREWLSPLIGSEHAAQLADAVNAAPPWPDAWSTGGATRGE